MHAAGERVDDCGCLRLSAVAKNVDHGVADLGVMFDAIGKGIGTRLDRAFDKIANHGPANVPARRCVSRGERSLGLSSRVKFCAACADDISL